MISMICYALWVTNMAAYMSDTVILLFFCPILRRFFLHFLLAKGLDKHFLHTIIPRTFEGMLSAEMERILQVTLIVPVIHSLQSSVRGP